MAGVIAVGFLFATSTLTAQAAPHVVVDSSFGNDGVATIAFATVTALASDGKILALGRDGETTVLYRYTRAGAPDLTFGNQGAVRLFIKGNPMVPRTSTSLLVAADGRIYVTGLAGDNCGIDLPCSGSLLARYLATGELDTSFGVNGVTPLSIAQYGPTGQDVRLAFGPDSSIVAAENAYTPGTRFFSVVVQSRLERFSSSGTSLASWPLASACRNGAYELGVEPNGTILAAVNITYGSSEVSRCLSRYTPDGNLDATFGASGVVDWAAYLGSWPNYSGMLLGPDGKVMLGVYATPSSTGTAGAVIRLGPEGHVDTAFGVPNGAAVAPANVRALANACRGKFVGAALGHDSFYTYVGLTRYNSNGSLDLTASGTADGIVSKFVSFIDEVQNVLVRDDGEIIVQVNGRTGTLGPQVNYLVAYRQLDCQHPTDSTLSPVVEFYNPSLNHYFATAAVADMAALDSGQFKGWQRTGYTFASASTVSNPVCRFYIPPAYGDSHFFSASSAECADVRTKFPQFVYETADAFQAATPAVVTGECSGTTPVPVYRVWNGKPDTNHRYVTDQDARDAMVAAGWIAEGYGPNAVAMCTKAE